MVRLLVSCVGALVLLASCSHTAPQPPTHSRASLVLENLAVQPGSQANVGIKIVSDDGWHIYWQNPGDSGEPPRMQWQLPAGITAGTLEWPVPRRMNNAAGTDYGYEGTTVLLSRLQFPSTVQPGATVELGGELRWLTCHEVCVPQRTALRAPVRIASANRLNNAAHLLLQSAAARIPKPMPADFHRAVTGSLDSFHLEITSPEAITQAEFFPSEEEQVDNAAAQALARTGSIIRLTLKKSEHLQHDPERLRGVIVLNGHDGYQLDVPIQHLAAHRKGGNRSQ